MANDDIIDYATAQFTLGIFISGILTLLAGGGLLLTNDIGQNTYENIMDSITYKAIQSTPNGFLENLINKAENPLIFDIVLGMINIAGLLIKLFVMLITILVNYVTISVWLVTGGVPSAITALIVLYWQVQNFRQVLGFVLKTDRIRPS